MEVSLAFESMLQLCVQGESIERFLNMCSYHNIRIFDIKRTESECYMKIYAVDFFLLKDIVKKSGVKVRVVRKKGVYFYLKKQAKKKVFIIASCLCLFLLWVSSRCLWGIKIEGNYSVTEDLITDFLRQNGIYYGMPLSEIPIYELKTNLRNTYDEITWISIYLEGTNLHIAIKENDTIKPQKTDVSSYSDVIADENGIIESILVRQGTAMVKEGNEVKKGDVLISGKVEIPAEDGTVKETRLCEADGDVYIVYDYPVDERISFEYLTKQYTGRSIEKKEIFFNHKKIPISFSKIPYIKYDTISERLEFPVLNLLSVPLEIKNLTFREYQIIRKKHSNAAAEKILREKLDKIILSLEEKGIQMIEKNVKMNTNSVYLSMTGNLILRKNVALK